MRRVGFLCSLLTLHCSLLTFTGCTVGPDFRKPEVKTPAEWHGLSPTAAPGKTALTSQPLELVEWWKSFDDPLLTSLVERAIKSNLDMRQAASRVRQARAAVGVTSAGMFPEINTDAQYQRTRTQTTAAGTGGVERDFFQTGLDASWELDFFGRTRRNVEASRADLQAAIEDRRDVLVTLVTDVGTNYSNLRQFQKQIEIARRNLAAQTHTAEITRKRYEAGFVGRLDLVNARAQAATTASRFPFWKRRQGVRFTT
ncbi:MAG: TolC family protein [Syntrophobacteraceae bacterium]